MPDFGEDFFEFADGDDDPDAEDEQADGFDDGGGWVHRVILARIYSLSPEYRGEGEEEIYDIVNSA